MVRLAESNTKAVGEHPCTGAVFPSTKGAVPLIFISFPPFTSDLTPFPLPLLLLSSTSPHPLGPSKHVKSLGLKVLGVGCPKRAPLWTDWGKGLTLRPLVCDCMVNYIADMLSYDFPRIISMYLNVLVIFRHLFYDFRRCIKIVIYFTPQVDLPHALVW